MNGTDMESGRQPHGHGASERLRRMLEASAEELEVIDRLLAGRCFQESGRVGPEDLLSKKELATRMRVTVRTVDNWQRKGALKYIRVGNTVLFCWPDVLAHWRANCQGSRKGPRPEKVQNWEAEGGDLGCQGRELGRGRGDGDLGRRAEA